MRLKINVCHPQQRSCICLIQMLNDHRGDYITHCVHESSLELVSRLFLVNFKTNESNLETLSFVSASVLFCQVPLGGYENKLMAASKKWPVGKNTMLQRIDAKCKV